MSGSCSWKDVIDSYLKYYDDYFMHLDNNLHFILFVEGYSDSERLYSLFHKENIKNELKSDFNFDIDKKDILYDFSNGFRNVDSYGRFLDGDSESVSDSRLQNECNELINKYNKETQGVIKSIVKLTDNSTKDLLIDNTGRKWTEDNASNIVSSYDIYGKIYKNFDFVIECINNKNNKMSNFPHIYCLGIIDRDVENHKSLFPNLVITEFRDYETTLIMPIFKKYIYKKIDIYFNNCLGKIAGSRFKPEDILFHMDIDDVLNSSITSRKFYSILGYNTKNDLYNDVCSRFTSLREKNRFNKDEEIENKNALDYLKNLFKHTIIQQINNVLLFTTKQGIVEYASFDYQAEYGYNYDIVFSSKLQFQVDKKREIVSPNVYRTKSNGSFAKIRNYNCVKDPTFDFSRNFEIDSNPFLNDIIRFCNDYANFKNFLNDQVKSKSKLIFGDDLESSPYMSTGVLSELDFNILFKDNMNKWFNMNNESDDRKNDSFIKSVFCLSNGHLILEGLCKIFIDFHKYNEKELFEDIISFYSSDDLIILYKLSPLNDFKNAYEQYLSERDESISISR